VVLFFSFGNLNDWTVFTIGLHGNFLLVLCFYWLVVYIEVYWILGIGNSFSKFCTMINTTISIFLIKIGIFFNCLWCMRIKIGDLTDGNFLIKSFVSTTYLEKQYLQTF
jgi:hypothetical protein